MIVPLPSRGRVCWSVSCMVRVLPLPAGVRFVQFRYESGGALSPTCVRRLLVRVLPAGSRWHAAGLAAVDASCRDREGCSRDGSCACVRWTDVLVDLGAVSTRAVLDVRSGCLDVGCCRPLVRACSPWRGCASPSSPPWALGWGGPFGFAFDRELSMLLAPVQCWRVGVRLLADVGDVLCPVGDEDGLRAAEEHPYVMDVLSFSPSVRRGVFFS